MTSHDTRDEAIVEAVARDEAIVEAVERYIDGFSLDEVVAYAVDSMVEYMNSCASDEEIDQLLEDTGVSYDML